MKNPLRFLFGMPQRIFCIYKNAAQKDDLCGMKDDSAAGRTDPYCKKALPMVHCVDSGQSELTGIRKR